MSRLLIPLIAALCFRSLNAADSLSAQAYETAVLNAVRQLAAEQCLNFKAELDAEFGDCRVSEVGVIGAVEDKTFYSALYCVMAQYQSKTTKCGDGSFEANYADARALVIFERSKDVGAFAVQRGYFDGENIFVYQRPRLHTVAGRTILHVPIRVDGSGAGNSSEYYEWSDGWQQIESEQWERDLVRAIPAGRALRKGIWPDLNAMTVEASLYREGDANCCPTGGRLTATLAIQDRKFVLNDVSFDTSVPPR